VGFLERRRQVRRVLGEELGEQVDSRRAPSPLITVDPAAQPVAIDGVRLTRLRGHALARGIPVPGQTWNPGSGAEGTRTPGLLDAIEALFQLSYSPTSA
jgi:hypothetical protein